MSGEERVSYGELDDQSARIRDRLVSAGVVPGDRVCLLLPKSPLAVAALLGVLRAGGAYVPLDTDSPVVRIARIVRRCDTRWVLAGRDTADLVVALTGEVEGLHVTWLSGDPVPSLPGGGVVEGPGPPGRGPAPEGADHAVAPGDLAYLMFTSGSTGEPKGVMITHGNVLSFIDWAVAYFGLGPDDRMSSHPPLHFDLSVFDVFGALAAGAELHLVPAHLNLLPNKLADFIDASRLTHWFSVPGVMTLIASFGLLRPGRFPELRRVLWCGEVLPTPTLISWMEALPGVRFTNLYGPTETTIASSHHTVDAPPEDPAEDLPIGLACGGEELLVLDEGMGPVKSGEQGDLWIGGAGVGLGYWRDPEKTAAAFVPDPRPGRSGRLYRTGDVASRPDDGLVRFHGRKDRQIKSRGYRIELGEIEAALRTLPEISEAAVVAAETGGFDSLSICCAFVSSGEQVEPARLKRALSSRIPSYMVPRRWKPVDRLPVNANGKVDYPLLRRWFEGGSPPPERTA